MGANGEHWLDLLAERQTRGRLLKTVLAGAVLTLPFAPAARASRARATANCGKPCGWTAENKLRRRKLGCAFSSTLNGAYYWLIAVPAIGGVGIAKISRGGCMELATLLNKADAWDCQQPDCSGYDPKGPDGPCEGNNGPCCPCSGCTSGFTPCSPGLCCNKAGTGCGYGSDCGG